MRWVRVWLPVAILLGGIAMIAGTGGSIEGWEGGGAMIGAGLSVWLLNVFFRIGVVGDRERDAEDRARDFYDEHGYWPDEAPEPGEAPEPERETEPEAGPRAHPHRRPPLDPEGGPGDRHPRRRIAGQGRRPRRP
jgi:hypothetical protein